MKYSFFTLKYLIPAFGVLFLSFTFLPGSPDGLWKANYVAAYEDGDTVVSLAKILLNIEDNNFTLVNYDDIFVDKKPFSNSGTINPDESILIFNKDSVNEKQLKFVISDDGHLSIKTGNNPNSEMVFSKLAKYNLGNLKDEMTESFLKNNYLFEFSYFNESVELEFNADKTFTVVNTVKPFFPVFSKWDILSYDGELFVYFSGMAPFVQITGYDNGVYECFDESDNHYTGRFIKTDNQIRFDKNLLSGIWEQKNAVDIDFNKVPGSLLSKDFYPRQVWIFSDSTAKKYEDFRISESPFEVSKNVEMITFLAFNSDSYRNFRILDLNETQLIVERYYGDFGVKQDTLIRKKKIPKATTVNDYLKRKK
jgi:hypothetical protein